MKRNSGFSLVEVMIVLAIVVLLAIIAVPSFARVRHDAENARAVKELQSLYTAIIIFETQNNRQPRSWDELAPYISVEGLKERYELNTEV